MFSLWIKDQEWTEINETHDVDHKVELLTSSVMEKVRQFFPEKLTKVTSDDAPWCSPKVRKLKLLKGREFNKHRSSIKWANLDKLYKSSLLAKPLSNIINSSIKQGVWPHSWKNETVTPVAKV